MPLQGSESEVRQQAEKAVGRPLTDEEWCTVRPALMGSAEATTGLGGAARPETASATPGTRASFADFLVKDLIPYLGMAMLAFAFGLAVAGLLYGIGWAYDLEGARFGGWLELIGAAVLFGVVLGMPVLTLRGASAVMAWLIVAGLVVAGLVALGIGVLIR